MTTDIIQSLTNVFHGLSSILKPIHDAFREIFPPMTGQKLVDMTVAFRNLSERFKMSEETATNLKNTYKGLYALSSSNKASICFFVIVSALSGWCWKYWSLKIPIESIAMTLSTL